MKIENLVVFVLLVSCVLFVVRSVGPIRCAVVVSVSLLEIQEGTQHLFYQG